MISTNLLRLIILSALIVSAAPPLAAADWPVDYPVDLSSNFGDYRSGHFHFGIDIRTGGVTGKRVLSPVDGYVWRVRTSYWGYGKALYIKGNDGYTYVLAHLSDFAGPIDDLVKSRQSVAKRYAQDIYLTPDSIKVRRGELVALSGQTGSGAPHLHFEKRAGDISINPLSHGYKVADKTRPVISRLGLQMTDDRTVFQNGRRKMFLKVVETGQPGQYRLDTTALFFNVPVGLLLDSYDLINGAGLRQGVYRTTLYVDDRPVYESRFDSVDFGKNYAVKVQYDLFEATEKRKHVRRLYHEFGNDFAGSKPYGPHNGILGRDAMLAPGRHEVKIVVEDASGNQSELRFPILWSGAEDLYVLDSTRQVARDSTDFYFTPRPELASFAVDSVAVYLNRGNVWARTVDASVERLAEGGLKVRAIGTTVPSALLRLHLFAAKGGEIRLPPFNGQLPYGGGRAKVTHEIVEDGLLIDIRTDDSKYFGSHVKLYDRDSLLGIEYPQMLTTTRLVSFIKPQARYARVDRYEVVLSLDTTYGASWVDTVNLLVAGLDSVQRVSLDEHFSLELGRDVFFSPTFLEVKKNRIFNRTSLLLNSDHYQVFPVTFATRRSFAITYDIPWKMDVNSQSGLCWLDEKQDKWIWLENTFDEVDDILVAPAGGGGSFAAVFDYTPPVISRQSIRHGSTVRDLRPAVNFTLSDTLSGIGSDEDILIELDGTWLIPEYEPETGQVRSGPLFDLEPGEHHLGIVVHDRAGNKAEQYLRFFVKRTERKQGG